MKLKNILTLVLALCMVFALCACGETKQPDNTEDTEPSSTAGETQETEETTEPQEDKVDYTVTVVDEEGKPIVGAMVQLCLEACIPGITNAEGFATFTVLEADYKVSFVSMPAGYTSDATEFYFDNGAYEMTITLKAA